MSTIAIAITTTVTSGFTASTLPASIPGGSARTIAATDKGVTDLAENVRRTIKDLFQGVGVNDNQVTVAVTVT